MAVMRVPEPSHRLSKQKTMPPPSAGGLSYPGLIDVYQTMAAQDARIVFDSIRPLADEFWNLIDGQRTIEQIARCCCLEFGFTLDSACFLPFAGQLLATGLATIDPHADNPETGEKDG